MLEIASSALLLGKIDDLSLNSKMHPPHFAARQHMQTVFGNKLASYQMHYFQVSQPEHSYMKHNER